MSFLQSLVQTQTLKDELNNTFFVILTEWMVIEEELHPSCHISEDVEAEEDDDKEGPKVTAAVHDDDSVEQQDYHKSNDMDHTNTKNQDHQPLFITKHNVVKKSLEGMFDSL